MARPKKTTEETWFDYFSDQTPAEQVLMLRMCEEINRQARRGKLGNGKPAQAETLALQETEA